jgi:hypothetical protein
MHAQTNGTGNSGTDVEKDHSLTFSLSETMLGVISLYVGTSLYSLSYVP